MKLYHIDRLRTLTDGQRIELKPLSELSNSVRNSHFVKSFQNGLAHHGEYYLDTRLNFKLCRELSYDGFSLIRANELDQDIRFSRSKSIELALEMIRQHNFPDAPSRLTSFFALGSLQGSDWELLRKNAQQIFEFEAPDDTPVYDASLLFGGMDLLWNGDYWKVDFSVAEFYDHLYAYWAGERTQTPQLEYLVQLPTLPIHKVYL